MSVQSAAACDVSPRLVRSLTLTHAVLYGLGVTIGAGIYVLVGVAAGRSGMHAPLAFIGAAVVMAFSAASFAELGTRMPVSASEAAYVQAAFRRDWLSLGVGLLVVATATISAATISVGSAGYVAVFLSVPAPWIISAVVLAMGVVACLATVQSVTFAGVMTLIEVGGLVLIIVAGLGHGTDVYHAPSGDLALPRRFDGLDWSSRNGTHRGLRLHRLRASRQRCRRDEGTKSHPAARAVPDPRFDRAALRTCCVDRRDGGASA